MSLDEPQAVENTSRREKSRILIVADAKAVRYSLKKVLDEMGYDVAGAADGDEGEKQFVASAPELVLLDLELPKQDGWEVLGIISAQAPLIPIVIIKIGK